MSAEDAATAVPPLLPVQGGLSAMPALLRSFSVPSAPNLHGVTPPLTAPTAAAFDRDSPRVQEIVSDAARMATSWASRHIRPSRNGRPTTSLSPAAAAALGAIHGAMADARSTLDGAAKPPRHSGGPTPSEGEQQQNPWAGRLRQRAVKTEPAAAEVQQLPAELVAANAAASKASASDAPLTRARKAARAEPVKHEEEEHDESTSKPPQAASGASGAAADEPAPPAAARPKRGRPAKSEAPHADQAEPQCSDASSALASLAASSEGAITAAVSSLVARAKSGLPAADSAHADPDFKAKLPPAVAACFDAGSRLAGNSKATAADVGTAASAVAFALTAVSRPQLECGTDEHTSETSVDAVATILRSTTRLLRHGAVGDATATKTTKATKAKAPGFAALLGPVHDCLRALGRLLQLQFAPSDAVTTFFTEEQVSRICEVAVSAAMAPHALDGKPDDGVLGACATYLVTPGLELVTALASLARSADTLLAEVGRALPDPGPHALVRPAALAPDSVTPIRVCAPVALVLRIAMAGAVLPWSVPRQVNRAAAAVAETSHALPAAGGNGPSLDPRRDVVDRCHSLCRRGIDGIVTRYLAPDAVAAHPLAKDGALAVLRVIGEDFCAALGAPEVPIADFAVRHIVSAVVRGCLPPHAALTTKAPAAIASKMRNAAVDIVGAAALAVLRAARYIDRDAALCELAWVTDADKAAFSHALTSAWVQGGSTAKTAASGSRGKKATTSAGDAAVPAMPSVDPDAPLTDRIEVVRFHALSAAYERDRHRNLPYLLARQLYAATWAAAEQHEASKQRAELTNAAMSGKGKGTKKPAEPVALARCRVVPDALLAHLPSQSAAPAPLDLGPDTQRMLRSQWATISGSDARSMLHPDSAEGLLRHLMSCLRPSGSSATDTDWSGWDAARTTATSAMAAMVKERPSLLLPAFIAIKGALVDPAARVREAAIGLLGTLLDRAERMLIAGGGGGGGDESQPLATQPSQDGLRTYEALAGSMVDALVELAGDRSALVASKALHGLLALLHDSAWLVHHPHAERAVVGRLVGLFARRGTPEAPVAEKHYDAVSHALVLRWFGVPATDHDGAGAAEASPGARLEGGDSDDDDRAYITLAAEKARAVRGRATKAAATGCDDARSQVLSSEERLRANAAELAYLTTAGSAPPFGFSLDDHPLARVLGRTPGAAKLHRQMSLSRARQDGDDAADSDADTKPKARKTTAAATKAGTASLLRQRAFVKSAETLVCFLTGVASGALPAAPYTAPAAPYDTVDVARGPAASSDAEESRPSRVIALLHLLAGSAPELVEPTADALFSIFTSAATAQQAPADATAAEDRAIVIIHMCGVLRHVGRTLPASELFAALTNVLNRYVGAHQQSVLIAAVGTLCGPATSFDGAMDASAGHSGLPPPNRHVFAVLNQMFHRLRSVTKNAASDAASQAYGCRFMFLLSELLRAADWAAKEPDDPALRLGTMATTPLPNMLDNQPGGAPRAVHLVYAASLQFLEQCPADTPAQARALSVAMRVVASACMQAPSEFWPRSEAVVRRCLMPAGALAAPEVQQQHAALHLQGLSAIRDFLSDEEAKIASAARAVAELKRASSRELNSGMGTWVLQRFHADVCRLTGAPQSSCRAVACDVLELAVSQGLLAPMINVAPLVALTADPTVQPGAGDSATSERAAAVLRSIADRHEDAVSIKAVPGVIGSFEASCAVLGTTAVPGYRDPTDWSAALSVHAPLFRVVAKMKRHREQLLSGTLRYLHQDSLLHEWPAKRVAAGGVDSSEHSVGAAHVCFLAFLARSVGTMPLTTESDIGAILGQVRTGTDLGSEVAGVWLSRAAGCTSASALAAAAAAIANTPGKASRSSTNGADDDEADHGGHLGGIGAPSPYVEAARVAGLLFLAALKRFLCKEFGIGTTRLQRLLDRAAGASAGPAVASSLSARTPNSAAFREFVASTDEIVATTCALVAAMATVTDASKPKPKGGKKGGSAGSGGTPLATAATQVHALLSIAMDDFAKDMLLGSNKPKAAGSDGAPATKRPRRRRIRVDDTSEASSDDASDSDSEASSDSDDSDE